MPIKLVNKTGVPEVLARACLVDKHRSYGDISVTKFIDAPQIHYLLAHNTVEEDVVNRLWMLLGTGVHHIIDRAEVAHASARQLLDAVEVLRDIGGDKNGKAADFLNTLARAKFPEAFSKDVITEKTLTVSIETDIGVLELSGTFDKFWVKKKLLEDYKVTSVWGYLYEESKKKWYAQMNTYAYMLRKSGFEVEEAQIMAIFKDYKEIEKVRNRDYPKAMAMEIPIPLHPQEKMEKWIKKRAELHLRAMNGDVEPCTPKEMWATNDTWKVTTKERKRAIKAGFISEEAANDFMEMNELKYIGMYKEFYPGERKRCDKFCPVASVCPQYAAYQELKSKLNN